MLNLSNVTLLCVETRNPELAHWAIDKCMSSVNFGRVVLVTELGRLTRKKPGVDYVQAPIILSTIDYSNLMLEGIAQHVQGTHVLVIQWDSFVINPTLWSNEFLNYDYIGPVWPHHPQTPVGNGGFSLRSLRLLESIKSAGFNKRHPEDYCICVDNKDFLEKEHGIRFAPVTIAEQFAVERSEWHDAFGFHGFFNFGKVLDDKELDSIFKILPDSYLSGLDSYGLIASLKEQGRIQIALKIGKRMKLKWKMRKRFLKLQLWLLWNRE